MTEQTTAKTTDAHGNEIQCIKDIDSGVADFVVNGDEITCWDIADVTAEEGLEDFMIIWNAAQDAVVEG